MKYYCPTQDTECPYCENKDFECTIGSPADECTDYYYYMKDLYGEDFDDEY